MRASVEIDVRATNALPVAAFSVYPPPAYPGQGIQFGAGASYDRTGRSSRTRGTTATDQVAAAADNAPVQPPGDVSRRPHRPRDNGGGERTATAELQITTTIDTSGTIPRYFEWDYNGTTQSCDLAISRDLYAYYTSQLRGPFSQRDYDDYVLDPLDDAYLETVTQEALGNTSGNRYAAFEDALIFVQHCIVYVNDPLWLESGGHKPYFRAQHWRAGDTIPNSRVPALRIGVMSPEGPRPRIGAVCRRRQGQGFTLRIGQLRVAGSRLSQRDRCRRGDIALALGPTTGLRRVSAHVGQRLPIVSLDGMIAQRYYTKR
jgi:hypothetical protein